MTFSDRKERLTDDFPHIDKLSKLISIKNE